MKTLVAVSFVGIWAAASTTVHSLPHRAPTSDPLLMGAEVEPPVANILGRACINCHSERTSWPWYSQLAPASWLIESDVKRARERLNLSHWDNLDPAEQRVLLT